MSEQRSAIYAARLQYLLDENHMKPSDLVEIAKHYWVERPDGKRVTINKVDISYYLHGKNGPGEHKAKIIAKIFNVNPAWVMGWDAPMHGDAQDESQMTKEQRELIDLARRCPPEIAKQALAALKGNIEIYEQALSDQQEASK